MHNTSVPFFKNLWEKDVQLIFPFLVGNQCDRWTWFDPTMNKDGKISDGIFIFIPTLKKEDELNICFIS